MTERLLQFIWQLRYFNKQALATTRGEALHILFPGIFNKNQGPDFSEAKIKIGNTTWAGNVEIHVKSSDWKKHQHDSDRNYDTVILHVVWEDDLTKNDSAADDCPGKMIQGPPVNRYNTLPVLELKDKVSKL